MSKSRFALFGSGFWAPCQLFGWREVPGVECVAICDPVVEKAQALAQRFGVRSVYADPEALFRNEKLDFVDIVSSVESHYPLALQAASHGIPAISQKPLTTSTDVGEKMVEAFSKKGIPLLVHENWRWQAPIREFKGILQQTKIGTPVHGRVSFVTSFDDISSQPYLKELDQLVIADFGIHLLDMIRFLFGEVTSLYCQTRSVREDVRGEDMATIVMRMENQMTVVCEISMACIPVEEDHYPQTLIFVQGAQGSLELAPDYRIRLTTSEGTFTRRYPPPRYEWADPDYAVVHASIPSCNAHLLAALRGEVPCETTAADNLRSLRLVTAAYESARTGEVVRI